MINKIDSLHPRTNEIALLYPVSQLPNLQVQDRSFISDITVKDHDLN